jgi:hypothetical protein
MLLYFTDAITKNNIAINPKFVVGVFRAVEGDVKDKTVISLINGSVVVEETETDVCGQISNALQAE